MGQYSDDGELAPRARAELNTRSLYEDIHSAARNLAYVPAREDALTKWQREQLELEATHARERTMATTTSTRSAPRSGRHGPTPASLARSPRTEFNVGKAHDHSRVIDLPALPLLRMRSDAAWPGSRGRQNSCPRLRIEALGGADFRSVLERGGGLPAFRAGAVPSPSIAYAGSAPTRAIGRRRAPR